MKVNKHDYYKQIGRCVSCGKPTKGNGVRCRACADKRNKEKRDNAAAGYCINCGKLREPSRKNNVCCVSCAKKNRDRERRRRERMRSETA